MTIPITDYDARVRAMEQALEHNVQTGTQLNVIGVIKEADRIANFLANGTVPQ